MNERENQQDERATREPADNPPEDQPGNDGDGGPGQDPVSSPGPYGNPEVDEEALRKKQEEGG